MKFEQYADFARTQWNLAMSGSEHFSLDKCTDREKVSFWDEKSSSYDLGIGADSRRVNAAMERLEKFSAFGPNAIALDIGSGTGAYALALSAKCGTVYALDSSPGMQKVLAEKAAARRIKNIIPVLADWQTVRKGELPGAFDVVLSSLNTGISDYDSLVKMNTLSRNVCCYIAPSGTSSHSSRADFQKIIFGRELRTAGGNDIIHAFNIIYGLGMRPELTYAPCEWSLAQSPEDALYAVCRDFSRYTEISSDLRAELKAYILSHLNEEGLFVQRQTSTVGIMVWSPKSCTL